MFQKDKNALLCDNYIISQTYTQNLSQFEIDTLRMYVPNEEASVRDRKFLLDLCNAREIYKNVYRGIFKGFNITINDFGTTVTGSPSNYYVGADKLLSHPELPNAIDQLGNELRLDLHNAFDLRTDVNFNIIGEPYIKDIHKNLFVYLSRFIRLEQDNGVRFQTKTIKNKISTFALLFYNKTQQLMGKGIVNPEFWYRIEFRIYKDINKHLGIKYVKDLYDHNNYIGLIEMLIKRYFQVVKQKVPIDIFNNQNSNLKYRDYLVLQGIQSIGGMEQVFRNLDQLDNSGHFPYRNKKSRLISYLKSIANNPANTNTHPIIEQLDNSIIGAYEQELYYLGFLPISKVS